MLADEAGVCDEKPEPTNHNHMPRVLVTSGNWEFERVVHSEWDMERCLSVTGTSAVYTPPSFRTGHGRAVQPSD